MTCKARHKRRFWKKKTEKTSNKKADLFKIKTMYICPLRAYSTKSKLVLGLMFGQQTQHLILSMLVILSDWAMRKKIKKKNCGRNRAYKRINTHKSKFACCRHLTTPTRIPFVFSLLFKSQRSLRTFASIATAHL